MCNRRLFETIKQFLVVVPMKIRGKVVFLFVFYFLNKYCYNILKKNYHSFHRIEIG